MFDDLLIRKGNCCVPQETEINNVRLANAYVPMQRLCETFSRSTVCGTELSSRRW